jgi:hypothetical protein
MSSEVQIAVIDQQDTQIVLAVPGVQGATGSEIAAGGTANQVLRKASSTDYDTDWSLVTSAMIEDGAIVDADVNASAAIAGTKISPNFGSQNVVTTGTSTAASFIPTSSSVPANGVYLPSANNVAISTNGTGQLFINSAGQVGIGTNGAQNKPLHIYSGANDSEIRLQTNSGTEQNAYLTLRNSGGNLDLYSVNGDIVLNPGNSPAAYFKTDGKLGLGTSSPSTFGAQLAVIGGSVHADRNIGGAAAQVQFSMGASSGSNFGQIGNTGTRWSLGYGATANTIGTEVLVWNSSGNVGIGTDSPSSFDSFANQLVVGTGSGNNGITIYAGTSNSSSLSFADGTGSSSFMGYIEYAHSNNSLQFYVNYPGSASPRMTIDSSGRLLVGTSSDVGTSTGTAIIARSPAGTNSPGEILIQNAYSLPGDGSSLGIVKFQDAAGSTYAQLAGVQDGTASSSSDVPGALVFSTNAGAPDTSPTPRMTITSGGSVLIGTTSDGSASDSGVVLTSGGASLWKADGTGDINQLDFYRGTSGSYAQVGKIVTNSSGTSFTSVSDYRLKENVIPLTSAIARINKLKPSQFNFITDPDKTVDGFIAHEAQAVVPECVTGAKDEVDDDGNPVYQGIDQSKLVPLLTAALQEALAEIESLKARVTALEP